jgi:hypothetical protein
VESVTLIVVPGAMFPLWNPASSVEPPAAAVERVEFVGKPVVLRTLSVCVVLDDRFFSVIVVPGANAKTCE